MVFERVAVQLLGMGMKVAAGKGPPGHQVRQGATARTPFPPAPDRSPVSKVLVMLCVKNAQNVLVPGPSVREDA